MQDRQLSQSKIQIINEIKEKVLKIRESLGLNKTFFEIVDIKIDNNILTIYTKNRSDKSTIIGPGGWVVGKLKEELKNFEIIKVEDITDYMLFKERVKLIKSLFRDDEVIQDICNYFLYNEIPKKKKDIICLIHCQYDLHTLNILNNIFNVKVIIYNFPALVPNKSKEKILNFLKQKNVNYEFLDLNLTKEEIKSLINKFPCGFLKDRIIESNLKGYIFTSCLECEVFKYSNGIIINFFELFPMKMKKDEFYLNYCPLCIQSCKIKENKIKFIRKVVKDVYNGFKEPTDASEEIISIL
ncbi:conserved protein of unknown function [Methanocaldococcus lauensis]|nr:conserved protein of unknown function [Methanocaldococcus lauensis]